MHRGDAHRTPAAVEADHLADAVAEVVPVRLRQKVELVMAEIHAAGGDLVQQRLPQMGARAIDQRDLGAVARAQPVAQPGRKLQPAGAATDDDNAVRGVGHGTGR